MSIMIDPLSPAGPLPSPCIGVCEMDARSGLCVGCTRTIAEIAEWGMAPEAQRRAIWVEIQRRRASNDKHSDRPAQ